MTYYVYILLLRHGQLYVGSTDNLGRRIAEHSAGTACRTTALSLPVKLLFSEPHPDRSAALKRERQLKRWSRAKKVALIGGNLMALKRLAGCRRARARQINSMKSARWIREMLLNGRVPTGRD